MSFYPHSLDWLGNDCKAAALLFILILCSAPFSLSAEPVLPMLTTDTKLATAGYYQLSWQAGPDGASHKDLRFELQQSSVDDFHSVKTIYRGPDRASVISGQPDGDYYYRIRIQAEQATTAWSHPVAVKVRHHSLNKAWWFFITGAVVFFITLLFIVVKSRHMDET